MSVFELLWIIFIVLKLTGLIDWSWWAVCSPFFIEVAILIYINVFPYGFDVVDKWFSKHDYTDLWK